MYTNVQTVASNQYGKLACRVLYTHMIKCMYIHPEYSAYFINMVQPKLTSAAYIITNSKQKIQEIKHAKVYLQF